MIAQPATKKRLLIGAPLHQPPCDAYRRAVNRFMRESIEGWEARWLELGGGGITVTRNIMASIAIKEGYDVLLFVAGDIGYREDDLAREVRRCLSHFERDPEHVHVVGGLYLFKRFPLQLALSQDEARHVDEFGLIEVEKTGTDFLAISTRAMNEVIDRWEFISTRLYGHGIPLAYDSYISNDAAYQGLQWNLFGQACVYAEEGNEINFLPEDFYWCRLAREAGFKIYVDSAIRLQHWGSACFDAAAVSGIDEALACPNPKPHEAAR
jgi:hypothetical protein